MLHVLVKTKDYGLRKAWYIDALTIRDMPVCVVVYKNNNNPKAFTIVDLVSVSLDTRIPVITEPVVDTLRSVNKKLKNKMLFNCPPVCGSCGRVHKPEDSCLLEGINFL